MKQKFKVAYTENTTKTYFVESHSIAREYMKSIADHFSIPNYEEYALYIALMPGNQRLFSNDSLFSHHSTSSYRSYSGYYKFGVGAVGVTEYWSQVGV